MEPDDDGEIVLPLTLSAIDADGWEGATAARY
jgi:hypothetical protein